MIVLSYYFTLLISTFFVSYTKVSYTFMYVGYFIFSRRILFFNNCSVPCKFESIDILIKTAIFYLHFISQIDLQSIQIEVMIMKTNKKMLYMQSRQHLNGSWFPWKHNKKRLINKSLQCVTSYGNVLKQSTGIQRPGSNHVMLS